MEPNELVPQEANGIIDAPDNQAVDIERDLLEATDNGWVEGDPLDQPDKPGGRAPIASAEMWSPGEPRGRRGRMTTNHTKYGAWYGADGQLWCPMFVSWCFDQAGAAQRVATSSAKGFANCPAGAGWYRHRAG